jgi:hypothetical protein
MALGAEAWVTVVALVEVLRRCAWSYFRVENEHATNCGMFRATLEVPLPFHDGELTDDEEDAAGPSTKEKAAAPEDPVAFGRAERIPTKRRVSLDAADGADGASVAFASPSVPSALARKRSAGAEELAGLSESDRRRSLDAAPADAQLAVSEDDRGEGGSGRSDRSGRSDDGSDRSVSSDEDSSARAARRFSLVHSDTEDFDSDAPMEPGSVKPREKHFPRVGTPPLKRTKSRFGREPSSPPRTRRSSLTIEVNVPTPTVVSAAASGGGGGASPQQQRISRGLEAIAKLVESSQSLQSADSDALAGDGAEESERRGEAGESEP